MAVVIAYLVSLYYSNLFIDAVYFVVLFIYLHNFLCEIIPLFCLFVYLVVFFFICQSKFCWRDLSFIAENLNAFCHLRVDLTMMTQ